MDPLHLMLSLGIHCEFKFMYKFRWNRHDGFLCLHVKCTYFEYFLMRSTRFVEFLNDLDAFELLCKVILFLFAILQIINTLFCFQVYDFNSVLKIFSLTSHDNILMNVKTKNFGFKVPTGILIFIFAMFTF